ncbi:MAG: MarR family winged helix-turn-helix transcriptional regulator [Sciscionella sp.]
MPEDPAREDPAPEDAAPDNAAAEQCGHAESTSQGHAEAARLSAADYAIADGIGTAMGRLFRMSAALAQQMGQQGIDRAGFVLMITLALNGPSRGSELAEAVFADRSTVSRQVAALAEDGLIERRADAKDGRASLLAITGKGMDYVQRQRDIRNRVISSALADWPLADRQRFAEFFTKFTLDYERGLPELIRGAADLD